MWVQLPRLVLANLHERNRRHGLGIVRGDDKVLACDAKEGLHYVLCCVVLCFGGVGCWSAVVGPGVMGCESVLGLFVLMVKVKELS